MDKMEEVTDVLRDPMNDKEYEDDFEQFEVEELVVEEDLSQSVSGPPTSEVEQAYPDDEEVPCSGSSCTLTLSASTSLGGSRVDSFRCACVLLAKSCGIHVITTNIH